MAELTQAQREAWNKILAAAGISASGTVYATINGATVAVNGNTVSPAG
jgi:hypothetical protein